MKIIDLLNKIANGEEVPKKIRIDHWSYKFEWSEHDSNYYDKHEDIDLMSCLSMNKEELNYEVHKIEEPQEHKIPEKLQGSCDMTTSEICRMNNIEVKINEILDYLEEIE